MKNKAGKNHLTVAGVIFFTLIIFLNNTAMGQTNQVAIVVDIDKDKGPLKPVWAYFGYDEPNYTYMKDGKKLLSELAALSPVPVYVRAHNLLTTGDGTPALKWGSTNAYTEDKKGRPIYNWAITDSIFDTYIKRGMKPIAEIGFMPEALSTNPKPYRHDWVPGVPYERIYTGWTYPPKDYKKWSDLVYNWVRHCVGRYGEEEVKTWWWEFWNEPNIGYWKGTEEEYFKLYDYTIEAVRKACPSARVGGPTTTGPRWDKAALFLQHFLEHCARGKNYVTGRTGTPLDYISFHAKGDPKVVDGHVQMNMAVELQDVSKGFEIVASFPEYRNLPIIIGECDPEGCAACSMKLNPQNAYRNGTMYSSYTAASFVRLYELAAYHNVNLEGAVSWSFEFENQPWFDGFRDLATNGVDKPVLNVFRMFGLMQGNRVETSGKASLSALEIRDKGVRGTVPDIDALATSDGKSASVMVWNYHDDNIPAESAAIEISINGIKEKRALLYHYRIDDNHSNSYEVWKKMGSPQQVTSEQFAILEKSGQLELLTSPQWIDIPDRKATIRFSLPRQGVSLLQVKW